MTPNILFAIAAAVVIGLILFTVRRSSSAGSGRGFDAGAVSTRWLAELRRDEPWTRS